MRSSGYWLRRTAALDADRPGRSLASDLAEATVLLLASRRPGLSHAAEAFLDAVERFDDRHAELLESSNARR